MRKESEKLEDERVDELRTAAAFAAKKGLPFNRFVTINWDMGGVASHASATAKFLKQLGDYLRESGSPFAYLWVAENGPKQGIHVHVLMHVDRAVVGTIRYRQRAWLKASGAKFCKGMIFSEPIGHRTTAYLENEGFQANQHRRQLTFAIHPAIVLAYVLKCCTQQAYRTLGSFFTPRSQRIIGRRSGYSHNPGPRVWTHLAQ